MHVLHHCANVGLGPCLDDLTNILSYHSWFLKMPFLSDDVAMKKPSWNTLRQNFEISLQINFWGLQNSVFCGMISQKQNLKSKFSSKTLHPPFFEVIFCLTNKKSDFNDRNKRSLKLAGNEKHSLCSREDD